MLKRTIIQEDVHCLAMPGDPTSAPRKHRQALRWAVFVLLACMAAAASALEPDASIASSQPTIAAATDPYGTDRNYHGGEYLEDTFLTNPTSSAGRFLGEKVAKLSNGDIVVAALVTNPGGNQTNGLFNIGLIRYEADGTPVRWTNAGSFLYATGQYIVYPMEDGAKYRDIVAIKAIGGHIVIAANYQANDTGDVDTRLLVFGEDGALQSISGVFVESNNVGEYAGGLATYGSDQIVVVATRVPPSGPPRPLFQRLRINPDGTFSTETPVIALNNWGCAGDASGPPCEIHGVATGFRGIGADPVIYLAAQRFMDGRWLVDLERILPNGLSDPGWKPANTTWNLSDVAGGNTYPVDIAVETGGLGIPGSPHTDTVYVAASIDRACRSGIAVGRFDNAGAMNSPASFGGDTTGPTLCGSVILANADYPKNMVLSGHRLAVVGFRAGRRSISICPGCEDVIDGELAILDTEHWELSSYATYPYPIHGPRDRHTGLWGIVATSDGRFVATGDVRYRADADVAPELRGKQAVVTVGFASDTIFENGFEN